jgi:4-hydroxybenzoate polyprenyltransferase
MESNGEHTMARSVSAHTYTNATPQIATYFRALRWRSWIGWLFIFGLGSTLFAIPPYNVLPIAISFSLVTGAIFVLNQYFDRKSDQSNPQKRHLPMASGELPPKHSSILIVSLFAAGLLITTAVDNTLLLLFIFYIAIGIFYSAPPLHFKKRPIIDLIAVGVGSALLPFLIGLQISHQLTLEFSLPWIIRRYQDALLCAIPLFLFQIASHIFQAIGDYEADREEGIRTFVVKYGKEGSAKIGTLFASLSLILPIIYGLLNLALATEFVYWYLLVFLLFFPFVIYLLKLSVTPTTKNIDALMGISRRFTPFMLLALYVFILILRFYMN